MSNYTSILQTAKTPNIKIPKRLCDQIIKSCKHEVHKDLGLGIYLFVLSLLCYLPEGKVKESGVIFDVKFGVSIISISKLFKLFCVPARKHNAFLQDFIKLLSIWGVQSKLVHCKGIDFLVVQCDDWGLANKEADGTGFYAQKCGFFFVSKEVVTKKIEEIQTIYKRQISEADAFFDMWLNISVNDPNAPVSIFGPVVYFPQMQNSKSLLSESDLALRWGWNRSRVNRYIHKLEEDNLLSRLHIGGRYGSTILMVSYLWELYPDVVDYQLPPKELIRHRLNVHSYRKFKNFIVSMLVCAKKVYKKAIFLMVYRPNHDTIGDTSLEKYQTLFISMSAIVQAFNKTRKKLILKGITPRLQLT